MNQRRDWVVDLAVGAVAGGAVGAIIAVNFIITIGIGYDVSIPDVFRDNVLSGIVTVAILIAGPVVGLWLMRRARKKREARQ
jgi:hypothetical protein